MKKPENKSMNWYKLPMQKCYLILAEEKATGRMVGYCEDSFSMSFHTTHAKLYYPYMGPKQFAEGERFIKRKYQEHVAGMQEYVKKLNAGDSTRRYFLVRVGSKNCPVKVNWGVYYAYKNKNKWDWRNIGITWK